MSLVKSRLLSALFFSCVIATSCKNNSEEKLFTLLTPEDTNVDFNNKLTEDFQNNVMRYHYFYNGAGVAVGDVNGDELEDIYFSGNMTSNKLYINEGDMKFRDVTAASKVSGRPKEWKTGVSMVDVNGDKKLDIFVCYSGQRSSSIQTNELFINKGNDSNGNPRFLEQAKLYGLADSTFSTQANFFDYDRDGDLDMFLLTHNPERLKYFDRHSLKILYSTPAPMVSIKLYQNNNNYFTDISKRAGLRSTALTYGLGAGVADVNNDGYQDIYVSNDYLIPDHFYINNGDGTFKDVLKESFPHISSNSMGNDIADINNDGEPDIYVLDMLPEDNKRQKLLFAQDNYELFDIGLDVGFHYQYMRNMLHVNNGNGTFSEIGQLAGVSNTDWSWSPLFADLDNDGWKDLFVTNGFLRDYNNMDFMKYSGDFFKNKMGPVEPKDIQQLINKMPASDVVNYVYKNKSNLTFESKGASWGIDIPSNSNGAAYSDLDNDGDLDLVTNNINQPAFIYRNDKNGRSNFLRIKLRGGQKNTQGLGAKVKLYANGSIQQLEQMPTRGYLSSVTPILHFGLGSATSIDSLKIIWLNGSEQVLKNLKPNQVVTFDEANAKPGKSQRSEETPVFKEAEVPFEFAHISNAINDFKRQPLMISPMSFSGPCLAKADVNKDGLEDVYVGGGAGQSGELFLQHRGGGFLRSIQPSFAADKACSDVDATFFDANGDGSVDLYVVSGGYDNFQPNEKSLQDRLYLNDGKGNLVKSDHSIPALPVSKSCVRTGDFNGDGQADIFLGGRVVPGRYPEAPASFILVNNGNGRFVDATAKIAPALSKIGMVTDGGWIDLNKDGKQDLIVVGEWMPITVFINSNGRLKDETSKYFGKNYVGWWNRVLIEDLNKDGRQDLLVGNYGLNSQCKVSDEQPAELFFKDFDKNGAIDPILCFYIQGKSYPYVTRDELFDQMTIMRTRFEDYKSYADAELEDVFSEEELEGAGHLKADFLKTALFMQNASGKFEESPLPLEVQYSPVFAMTSLDYNSDGYKDILMAGNISRSRIRFGNLDSNYGLLLRGNKEGTFKYINQRLSGLNVTGDVRSVLKLSDRIVFGRNQKPVVAYQLTSQ